MLALSRVSGDARTLNFIYESLTVNLKEKRGLLFLVLNNEMSLLIMVDEKYSFNSKK